MKYAMETENGETIFSFEQLGSLRMTIGGIVMLPFGIYYRKRLKNRKDFVSLLIVGSCGNFFPAFLFAFAETELSSGVAGILNGFTSFFTIIIGISLFKQKAIKRQFLGLIIAFLGLLLLILFGKISNGNGSLLHIGAIVLATIMYGLSLNTIKHRLSHFKALEITSLAFSIMFWPALAVSFFNNSFQTALTNTNAQQGMIAVSLLSVVGTCVALVLFNRIIALKNAVFASTVTYMMPIVATCLGIFFLKESLLLVQLIGMAVIISGVFVANYSKRWNCFQRA
jgi:drug/metabolite transporter (DMT)-like permease